MKILTALLMLSALPAFAADAETFGNSFYKRTGQIKDVEMVDSTVCPGFDEYVRTHGHCPQMAAEPESFGDEFYARTGQIAAPENKGLARKIEDVRSCLDDWAKQAKGTSLQRYPLSEPSTTITGGLPETGQCLGAVARCLKVKDDIYSPPDTRTKQGWEHAKQLDQGSISALVNDIEENIR